MTETLDLDTPDVSLRVADGIAVLTLDRPKVNALSEAMQDACGRAAVLVAGRDDVAAMVVTGGRRTFAAGVDINELAASDARRMADRVTVMHESYGRLAACPKPVVAAINGYALGGGFELALCADVRIAAADAVVGFPEVKLGLIPGAGGTQRLARLVGPSRAKEMIFTGRMVEADEALALGLVTRVVPADDVLEVATAWARQFVGQAGLALRAAKETIDTGIETDLASGLAIERHRFAALFDTQDKQIGIESFLAHGPGRATFTGR